MAEGDDIPDPVEPTSQSSMNIVQIFLLTLQMLISPLTQATSEKMMKVHLRLLVILKHQLSLANQYPPNIWIYPS